MNPNSQKKIITNTQEAAPTRDILLAVSSALRGDRKQVRLLVAKTQKRIEKRLQKELRALGRSKAKPSKKKSKIRGARLAPPKQLSPMVPPGTVLTSGADGRQVRIIAARHNDILAIRRVSGINTKRAYNAISHNSRAIDQLAASQKELADRITKLQSNGDLALLRGLVEGLTNLERRIKGVKRDQDEALGKQKRADQKRFAYQKRALVRQTRAAQMQKLQGVVASVQSAAFGSKGSLLTTNNLLLAANQLGWSFAPQIVEALGLAKPGGTSTLGWLAPLGSLITSQVSLGRRQHERFVSGVEADFKIQTGSNFAMSTFSLQNHIAPAEWESFTKRTDVIVTTVVIEPRGALKLGILSSGEVNAGNLSIRIEAGAYPYALPSRVVASWTVDTRRPNG